MSVVKILNEDWTDYDNKKIRDNRDSRFFACSETWEVEHLIKQIKKHYPSKSDSEIRVAIATCCRLVGSPHPRKAFIECVVNRL